MKRRTNEPPTDDEEVDLANNVGHLIRRSQQRVAAVYAQEIGREMSSPQFSLLHAVLQNPGLAQVDFVQKVGIDRSTLSAMVDRLVKRGLLTRERMSHDQRVDALFISPKGAAAVRKAIPGAHAVHRRVMQLLPAEVRPAFIQALTILAEHPAETAKKAARKTPEKKPARKAAPAVDTDAQ